MRIVKSVQLEFLDAKEFHSTAVAVTSVHDLKLLMTRQKEKHLARVATWRQLTLTHTGPVALHHHGFH